MKYEGTEALTLQIRKIIAIMLWDAEAMKVNFEEPFKLTSGNYSPIYINCRQVISDPGFMRFFIASADMTCSRGGIEFDVVAGGETAGIPFASYMANSLSVPMVYVRKREKGHGLSSLVEGNIKHGSKVLLVEDLITDAESKLHFINALRAHGCTVENTLVLFDRQQGGREALQGNGVGLIALTDMDTALGVAEEIGIVSADHLDSVREYLRSPREWHHARGLIFN